MPFKPDEFHQEMHYIAGLNHSQRSQYIRNKRLQIFKTVTAGSQYHKPNHHRVQILLVTNSLVHSDKNVEFRLSKPDQRPIDVAGPACLRHGWYLMVIKVSS